MQPYATAHFDPIHYRPAYPYTANSSATLRFGSEEHKRALCHVMTGYFNAYKPNVIAWPELSPDAKARLTGLPFWDIAVHTEGYAQAKMQAMADRTTDPIVKEALGLNAFEEGRHKHVLHHMLDFYQIPLAEEPPYRVARDVEWSYLTTGYGECLDSFFAFGLFRMARESGFFPRELVEVFEPIVQEEARHIVFFVNWVAWKAASLPWWKRLLFRAKCLASLAAVGIDRMALASMEDKGSSGDNFVVTGGADLAVNLTLRGLLAVSLEENTRRMALYDARLARPQIMPWMARRMLWVLERFRFERRQSPQPA